MMLSREQRADLITARGTLRGASAGLDGCDFDRAASMVDRVLAHSWPHDPETWHISLDVKSGRPLVACYECGVTWYSDFVEALAT